MLINWYNCFFLSIFITVLLQIRQSIYLQLEKTIKILTFVKKKKKKNGLEDLSYQRKTFIMFL